MRSLNLGDCDAARQRFETISKTECCNSCHYEWEDGYGEPGEIMVYGEGYFAVCCNLSVKYRGTEPL